MAVTNLAANARPWHPSESQEKSRRSLGGGCVGEPQRERENDLRRPRWRGKGMVRKRPRIEPIDDWQEILPLCWWPEQVEYERIRQPVLFGGPVGQRAEETGVSERTLQRRIRSFEKDGIEGLLSTEKARRRRLPPNVRRLIVDLKAEYPPFNLNEIANVVRACFGRKPDVRSVKRVLDEEARPVKLERNSPVTTRWRRLRRAKVERPSWSCGWTAGARKPKPVISASIARPSTVPWSGSKRKALPVLKTDLTEGPPG